LEEEETKVEEEEEEEEEVGTLSIRQVLRYILTNHTTHKRGTSMKGPTGPISSRNKYSCK
jgi:hypothetical protein